MTDAKTLALLDTLLPGDAALPPFSQAGIDAALLAPAAGPILAAIAAAALQADAVAEVQRVAQRRPDEFRALLNQALAAYYQAPKVLAALGWRSEPPQPMGHRLSGDDDAAWRMLDKVRRRGALWRS